MVRDRPADLAASRRAGLRILTLALAAGFAAGCGGGDAVRLPTSGTPHPVRGKLTVPAGKSIAGAKVNLVPDGFAGPTPTGEVKADGSFELTSVTAGDGAADGSYKVKIDPPPGVPLAKTVIPGRFADEDSSGLKVVIKADTAEIPPISLAPDAKAAPGRRD